MGNNKNGAIHKTKIGGQALIEGIMMRGPEKAALAVRQKDGGIYFEEWEPGAKKWYQKALFIRGIFNFVLQMADGYKYITISAEKSGMLDDEDEKTKSNDVNKDESKDEDTSEDESKDENANQDESKDENANQDESKDENTSEDENQKENKNGGKSCLADIVMTIGMIVGVGLSVLLFMFVPTWIYTGIGTLAGDVNIAPYRSLFEGVIKILIFIIYLWLTSLLKDIRTTYEYHGAEHKTIAAYEAGDELTVENIKKHIRFHPRCGTSFVFLTLAISILLYSVVPINSEDLAMTFGIGKFAADALRVAFKLALLPVLVGISYEVLRLAGRSDSVVMKIVSAPGLALQRLTTKEPNDKQIEIAIAAMTPVIPADKEIDKW